MYVLLEKVTSHLCVYPLNENSPEIPRLKSGEVDVPKILSIKLSIFLLIHERHS